LISSVLLVIVVIGLLITVHEFGHLLMAKAAKIPVEAFSIGFGPVLLRKRFAETEYRLALVPLGGFIKMSGEESQVAGGFLDRPVGIRMAVIAAGPVSNLVLGFLLLCVMYAVFGMSYIAPVIDPAPGGSAEAAGLRTGDVVQSVAGAPVRDFDFLEQAIYSNAGKTIDFTVLRDSRAETVSWTVPADTWADGKVAIVEEVRADGPAAQAGLLAGDTIVSIDGEPVARWDDVGRLVRASHHGKLAVQWRRAGALMSESIAPTSAVDPNTAERTRQIGIMVEVPYRQVEPLISPVVGQVRRGSPAARAGLERGDTITAVGPTPVVRWDEYRAIIQDSPGKSVEIAWRRGGREMSASLTPTPTADQITGEKHGEIGILPAMPRERLGLFAATWQAVQRSGDLVVRTFEIVYKVITRRIPGRAIGGPVFVAKVTYEGTSWGPEYLIALWALLSINLFVVNMLPVPVLDGGHIALFAVEAIRRRRLTDREMTWAMRVGWALIGLLFAFLIFNDILRLINR
jgi:regulator of sigma E protease